MDTGTLARFEDTLRQTVPSFRVRFKNESLSQKVIAILSGLFNPGYMTDYTTTFGTTVYFPSREFYRDDPEESFLLLAHEFTHMCDEKDDRWYKLKYAFPQILVLIPLLVFAALAGSKAWVLLLPIAGYGLGSFLALKSRPLGIALLALSFLSTAWLSWWLLKWKALTLLGMIALAPWPAPWRRQSELRGYGMSVGVRQWLSGQVPADVAVGYTAQFTGPAYYYMCRDGVYIQRSLEATRQQAQQGALQRISPYAVVHDFLYRERLLRQSLGVA